MKVNKCDICDAIYDPKIEQGRRFAILEYGLYDKHVECSWPDRKLDLCKECQKKLERFINRKD